MTGRVEGLGCSSDARPGERLSWPDHVRPCICLLIPRESLGKLEIDSPWLAILLISDHDHPMAYCVRCERSFPNNRALEQHKENSSAHWICYDCDFDFGSFDAQREHYIQSRDHHYCKEHDRHFEFEESMIQHMEAKHWYCRTHRRTFVTKAGLQSHYSNSSDHHFCAKCGDDFDDDDELWDHAEKNHHACQPCRKVFNSLAELRKHNGRVHVHRTGVNERQPQPGVCHEWGCVMM